MFITSLFQKYLPNRTITYNPRVEVRDERWPQDEENHFPRVLGTGGPKPSSHNCPTGVRFKGDPEKPPIHSVCPADKLPEQALYPVWLEQQTNSDDSPNGEMKG